MGQGKGKREGRRPAAGFTLIELLVTLAVAAILAAVAIPSFAVFLRENRATAEANAMLRVLTLARSEAVKQARSVVVCIPEDQVGSACSTSATRWDQGIMVSTDGTSDTLIHLEAPFSIASQITGNNSVARRFAFDSAGRFDGGVGGTLTLNQGEAGIGERRIIISTAGRTRIER